MPSVSTELFRMVAAIRHDPTISAIDRELFRPVFVAHDDGQVCAVPETVERRIRHYAGRVAASPTNQ
ncbi:hypothetical protein [Burkholderia cenocepacia]|uniref:hypothetical protein n=1 Tax=Burkholderia cenocepacia TaxID=95486 RepID=UPI0022381613|nr:hypothetical protein [Burkholderia cenocepacia]MCW5141093.1 hypothetical protein [Burkholderia cenocepacia]